MKEAYVMKVRIKFTKEGPMKFVGHLDTMRYFQKAIRRAELPIAFSGGYSPHMIMSFAAPLGVGVTSTGEYFDMELTATIPTDEICQRLNSQMVDGIHVLSARQVEDGKASKAMSLVAAADYLVEFRPGKAPADGWQTRITEFLKQPEILVTKETKKGEKQVDIRPFIYKMNLGLKGIGIATVIANLLLCIYCLIDLSIKREIAREYLKFNKDIFKKILRLGFPSSLTTTTNSLSFILINIFVVKYGNDVLAAYGVGNRINNIIYVLVNGIGSSVAILVGHSIGAGKIKEIREILLAGIKIGLIVGIVSVIFLYWNLDIAVGILTSDEMIKYHSINYLKIMLISVIPWVIFQVLAGVFQGTGHTTFNMYCHVGRIWIFRVPFIYFLERILELKEYSIWYSMLLSNLCALLFSIFLYRKIDWKRRED